MDSTHVLASSQQVHYQPSHHPASNLLLMDSSQLSFCIYLLPSLHASSPSPFLSFFSFYLVTSFFSNFLRLLFLFKIICDLECFADILSWWISPCFHFMCVKLVEQSRETQTMERKPGTHVEANAASTSAMVDKDDISAPSPWTHFLFCILTMHLSLAPFAVLFPSWAYGIATWKYC